MRPSLLHYRMRKPAYVETDLRVFVGSHVTTITLQKISDSDFCGLALFWGFLVCNKAFAVVLMQCPPDQSIRLGRRRDRLHPEPGVHEKGLRCSAKAY
jgi:hypothetical protein